VRLALAPKAVEAEEGEVVVGASIKRRSKITLNSSSGPMRRPVWAFLFSIWKGEI